MGPAGLLLSVGTQLPEAPTGSPACDLSVVLNSGSNAAAVPTWSPCLNTAPQGSERANSFLRAAQQDRGQALGLSGWVSEGGAELWAVLVGP